ncbi:hypothetical protein L0337_40275 [candidate division KSB1 bacterium]|nr:hypothetical protein [candidate division KSB1 bacterium]
MVSPTSIILPHCVRVVQSRRVAFFLIESRELNTSLRFWFQDFFASLKMSVPVSISTVKRKPLRKFMPIKPGIVDCDGNGIWYNEHRKVLPNHSANANFFHVADWYIHWFMMRRENSLSSNRINFNSEIRNIPLVDSSGCGAGIK